uniref:Zona pellucida sperm-binding protein 3 n=1 Tax=Geotrypetes seraphini TaxID=260995 RepID=A0A6P8PZM2_GEOSA|nr:zona pellucida sperm-binding protein 3-like isoform X2 [Geotrypetes seraphini]
MGQRVTLGFGVLMWLLTELLSTSSWGSLQRDSLAGTPSGSLLSEHRPHGVYVPWLRPGQLRDVRLHPVAVQCKEAKMVIIVRKDLFGTGRLIKATDLSLGPASCKATTSGVGETVTFEVGLHECGSILQMTQDSLIYRTHLSYKPKPSGSQVIVRSNPAVVPIHCTYPRTGNVSSKAIKPTWAPFSSTISTEEKLAFILRLMNDDWSAERTSAVFHLGEELHIEASVNAGDHIPMILLVDNCVATVSPDKDSKPRYNIVDFYGCLVDGKQEDSFSAFRSPRIQSDKIQFTVDAFRFSERESLIYITCSLRATAIDQAPDPLHKACSFSKVNNVWSSVEGPRNICSCCETGNCGPQDLTRGLRPFFPVPRRIGRAAPSDSDVNSTFASQLEDVVIGPLFILEDSHLAMTKDQAVSTTPVPELVLMAVVGVLSCMVVMGSLLLCQRRKVVSVST